MNNLCIIAPARSSCENFLSIISLDRVKFNSYDMVYEAEHEICFPIKRHFVKIYLDTICNEKVISLINKLKDYDFIYFHRNNIFKQFLTKRMQDNLIGEYGKDYRNFSIDFKDYDQYVEKYKEYDKTFRQLFEQKKYIDYDMDLNNLIITKELLDLKCFSKNLFEDAFKEDLCTKYVDNYKKFLDYYERRK